jgi:hypothetical protein
MHEAQPRCAERALLHAVAALAWTAVDAAAGPPAASRLLAGACGPSWFAEAYGPAVAAR